MGLQDRLIGAVVAIVVYTLILLFAEFVVRQRRRSSTEKELSEFAANENRRTLRTQTQALMDQDYEANGVLGQAVVHSFVLQH